MMMVFYILNIEEKIHLDNLYKKKLIIYKTLKFKAL